MMGHAAGALEEQCEQCLLQMSSQGRLHLDSVGKVCVVSCFVERRKYHKDIIGYTVIDVIGIATNALELHARSSISV